MRFGVAGPQQPGIVGARPHRQHFERIEALGLRLRLGQPHEQRLEGGPEVPLRG